jgi:uncharacterized protein (DUF433 family)
MELTVVQHITVTPGLRSGKPHIAGRRITVSDVAFFHLEWGMSADEIAAEYNLSLGEVYAALSYYFDHRAEIDQRTAEDEAFAEEMRKYYPSLLEEKLKALGKSKEELLRELRGSSQ